MLKISTALLLDDLPVRANTFGVVFCYDFTVWVIL